MDKIFVLCDTSKIYQGDVEKINEYLAEKSNRFVSGITPIAQIGEGSNRPYGCVIVVSERPEVVFDGPII